MKTNKKKAATLLIVIILCFVVAMMSLSVVSVLSSYSKKVNQNKSLLKERVLN